ncbi:16185_t:CDS:1 [Racocetra persica]|uniref:16185_t:CDS:1 n=1 Tax=Racocetra persica TaxID=160502 RepID=A0ACA9NWD5_9GLOM|nr:16185_t:CDS:1 [Racocetra persica]
MLHMRNLMHLYIRGNCISFVLSEFANVSNSSKKSHCDSAFNSPNVAERSLNKSSFKSSTYEISLEVEIFNESLLKKTFKKAHANSGPLSLPNRQILKGK